MTDLVEGDVLEGATEIALFLYGDAKKRRRIFYLAERGALPTFKLGETVCARRSTLVRWIEDQEKGAGAHG